MDRDTFLAGALADHRAGRLGPAEDGYRRLIAADPDDPDANHYLGILLKQKGDVDAALGHLARAAGARPDDAAIRQNLAVALHDCGRFGEAEDAFAAVLALDPARVPARLGAGIAAAAQSRYAEAERHFRALIAVAPQHADGHCNLGIALRMTGRADEAVAAFRRAVAIEPGLVKAHVNLGQTLLAARHPAEAVAALTALAAIAPGLAQAHFDLGLALAELGRPAEAVAAFDRTIAIVPDLCPAHVHKGIALCRMNRTEEGIAAFRAALALDPACAENHFNLANALRAQGRLEEAVAAYRRAIDLAPAYAEAQTNLGVALKELNRSAEAVAAYRAALVIRPDYRDAWSNLGNALRESGRLDDSEEACRQAIALDGDFAGAHANLCAVLQEQGRFEEAVISGRRALALDPGHARAHLDLGSALNQQERLDEAEAAYRAAIALTPDCAEAHDNLAVNLLAQARHAEALASAGTAVRLKPGDARAWRTRLAVATYHDGLGLDELGALHREFGRAFAQPKATPPAGSGGLRLRIGYLSSDLRDHPVGRNMQPVFRHHDRAAYSLHFYANVQRPDATTAAIRALGESWCDISGLSDAEAARRIRADGIDILVSLAGSLDRNRPTICAHRAAPVQIAMHDIATSGLAEMDYIIADPWLIPRRSKEWFSERPLRLPHFYVADSLAAPAARSRAPGPPVLACFNNPSKIGPMPLRLWGAILARAPEARLVLGYKDRYRSDRLRERILAALVDAGATAGRIEFLTDAATPAAFLERYDHIDLELDTFPFSGSTTSFVALSMGVPVVTWPWDRMIGRWTMAMLETLGLPQLVADSADDYVRIAVDAANAIAGWRDRRQDIRRTLAASPLCDGAHWTRNLERLYRAAWRRRSA